jgi:hypothetical protein
MISNIDSNKAITPATTDVPAKLTVTIGQDPSQMVNGKLRIVFRPSDLPGEPTALKVGGHTYQVDKRLVPFGGPGGGAQGGSLYFQADVTPFTKDGTHDAEVKLTTNSGSKWVPLTLNVLIALH